ncbi:GntR family transcriptional regulator [Companilactobacillus sp. DQM5]|uniref:GntR family transcriptional regulator n=1 Tax=Companilactobacillus sp. DQM5 TaxID=3463359 RepID=UPI0040598FA5
MEFRASIPIYLQIKDLIKNKIVSNNYKIGSKIPSVREFSVDLGVNINTVQKALNELVQEKIIVTQRGKGNFVTDNTEVILELKQEIIKNTIDEMYKKLFDLGLSREEITTYLSQFVMEGE